MDGGNTSLEIVKFKVVFVCRNRSLSTTVSSIPSPVEITLAYNAIQSHPSDISLYSSHGWHNLLKYIFQP